MTTIRIGGVPEYFNLPIHQAIASGYLEQKGITLKWKSVKEGTGAMSQMLSEGELDLAVVLTEGATKAIIGGGDFRIIKDFVTSPLTWGVHTGDNINQLDQLSSRRIAISRFGSGSHMMAFLLAEKKGWDLDSLEFVTINNLEGAFEAFQQNEVDIFLWEKYTTKPFLEANNLNCVENLKTPWPCFALTANNAFAKNHAKVLSEVISSLNYWCDQTQKDPELAHKIHEDYSLSEKDAKIAAGEVKWSTAQKVDESAIALVIKTYENLGIISKTHAVNEIIWPNL